MKKLICLFIILPFLSFSCVEIGDESYRVTFKYLNNTSSNIIITQFGTLFEGEDSILQIEAGQNIDLATHYKKPFLLKDSVVVTCNGKKVVQKRKDNAPLFDTTKYECLFYEKVREPNTCYTINIVYQFEFTDEFFND